MSEVIYRLLEMLALVLCLHSLSGEKVKLDICNVGFIVIELTFMQMIQDGIVSKQLYFAVYLIYFVFAYIKFKNTIQRTILKCMLVTLIMGGLQIVVYIPMFFISPIIRNETIVVIIINSIIFMILMLTSKSNKYQYLIDFCESKDWILKMSFFICITIIVYFMYELKKSEIIEIDIFILISLFMMILLIFIYRWQKSVFELDRKDRELSITNLYNGVFEDLIKTIRWKQHDFHNQIDAMYSMHFTANSLDELIEAQSEYCDNLIYENRYSKVLSCTNNSTLAGFVYSKFKNAEQVGIEIEYDISFTGNTLIVLYDLIEIVGVLMDNAIEAVTGSKLPQKIKFLLNDYNGLYISIKNPVINISYNDIEKFFEKEYTTKVSGSGIGLSKIKEYQKKYKYNIYTCINKESDFQWIEFRIEENK